MGLTNSTGKEFGFIEMSVAMQWYTVNKAHWLVVPYARSIYKTVGNKNTYTALLKGETRRNNTLVQEKIQQLVPLKLLPGQLFPTTGALLLKDDNSYP